MKKIKRYLILKKSDNNYKCINFNDQTLVTLYFFLDDCQQFGINTFKELINDPVQKIGGGNAFSWKKEKNTVVFTLDFIEQDESSFETTLEELNRILDQWEEILKTMPEDVVLVFDSTLANSSPIFVEDNKSTSHE